MGGQAAVAQRQALRLNGLKVGHAGHDEQQGIDDVRIDERRGQGDAGLREGVGDLTKERHMAGQIARQRVARQRLAGGERQLRAHQRVVILKRQERHDAEPVVCVIAGEDGVPVQAACKGERALGGHAKRRHALRLKQRLAGRGQRAGGQRLVRIEADGQLARKAGSEHVLRADIQAKHARERHQHHRGEDADDAERRAAAHHAVAHAGDGDEVVRPVVVALVLLHQAEQEDAAALKAERRAADDQQDGDEEEGERLHGVARRDGHDIARHEHRRAQQRVERQKARRLVAGPAALHQPKRAGAQDMDD